MIRLIIVIIFLILFFLLTLPLLFIEWLIGKKDPDKARAITLKRVQWAFRVLVVLAGTRYTVLGLENIPRDQSVLFVGNHQSYFDIVAAYGILPVPTAFVAKDGTAKVPFLAMYMKRVRCLFLNRDNLREGAKTIMQAVNYVKDGTSIFIFPEGKRNMTGDETAIQPFHGGSFKIAQKGHCPIIPVAITGTYNILEKHMPLIRSSKVTVEFGKPMTYEEMEPETRKNPAAYYEALIGDMVKKNHVEQ